MPARSAPKTGWRHFVPVLVLVCLGLGLSIVVPLVAIKASDPAPWMLAGILGTVLSAVGFAVGRRGRVRSEQRLAEGSEALDREVSAHARTAEAERRAAERYRAVIDNAHDAIITIDSRGQIQTFNKAAERIFGYGEAEVRGRNVNCLMPEPYSSAHDSYLSNYLNTGVAKIIGTGREVQARRKDGSIFPIDLSIGEMNIASQRGFIGVIRDITDRREAERQLRDAVERFRAVIDSAHDAIIAIDERGVVQTFNRGAERIFGYRSDEVVGRNVSMLMPQPYRGAHDGYLHNYLTTGVAKIIGTGREVEAQRKDGTIFPIDLSIGEMRVADRRGFIGVIRDVTERRRAEKRVQDLTAELVHVSRLSAMGQLSSALAHELNQPLSSIMNYAEASRHLLANLDTPVPARILEMLEKTSGQADRAGQIIRRLRGFVEKGVVERSSESLAAVVEEASILGGTGARVEGIETRLELAAGLPPIQIDKVQIQQVVVNLVRNAIEVLREVDRRGLIIRTSRNDDRTQEVMVADTGPGIAPDVARELFKPFVTTKKGGMGIGLSISRSIVEAHGGRLWAEPNPGGGTIFRFTLPEQSDLNEAS
jgi:two-component system sensor kinase FixL